MVQSMWKTARQFLKKKNYITIWASNSTSGYSYPKELKAGSLRYVYTYVIAALVTTAKTRKQSKCPSTEEYPRESGTSTSWSIIQPWKQKDTLTQATARRKPEDTMRQAQAGCTSTDTARVHSHEVLRVVKSHETERKTMTARSWGEADGGNESLSV